MEFTIFPFEKGYFVEVKEEQTSRVSCGIINLLKRLVIERGE